MGQVRSAVSRVVVRWAEQFAITTAAIQVRIASTTTAYPAAVVKVRLLAPMEPVMEDSIWIGTRTSGNIGAPLNVEIVISVRAALDIRFREVLGIDIIVIIIRSSTGMAPPQTQIIVCVFQILMTMMRQMTPMTAVFVFQLNPEAETYLIRLMKTSQTINLSKVQDSEARFKEVIRLVRSI